MLIFLQKRIEICIDNLGSNTAETLHRINMTIIYRKPWQHMNSTHMCIFRMPTVSDMAGCVFLCLSFNMKCTLLEGNVESCQNHKDKRNTLLMDQNQWKPMVQSLTISNITKFEIVSMKISLIYVKIDTTAHILYQWWCNGNRSCSSPHICIVSKII